MIGSQAILGAFPDLNEFPEPLVRSVEIDFLPVPDPGEELADRIDALLGELSQFHETHGVYAEGVGERTATVPPGWQRRLIRYQSDATEGIAALCLEPHDLAVAKLVAGRPKDYDYCRALISTGLADPIVVLERLAATTDVEASVRSGVVSWLHAQGASAHGDVESDQRPALERNHKAQAETPGPPGEVPVPE